MEGGKVEGVCMVKTAWGTAVSTDPNCLPSAHLRDHAIRHTRQSGGAQPRMQGSRGQRSLDRR